MCSNASFALLGCHETRIVEKGKALNFQNSFCPHSYLLYGHEFWVITERVRSQVQASEMRFQQRIEEVTLFKKVHSSEIRKSLDIEPLFLRIERSQLKWFGHVRRMPHEKLPKQALLAKANRKKPAVEQSRLDEPITLNILDEIAWDFTQAK